MKERAKELKAAKRTGTRGKKADEESAVLAKIAEMPEPDRAATLGFNDAANLDEGTMWPTAYGLAKLSAADEATVGALVRKAVS